MYTLINKLTVRELIVCQAPALFGALAIAELFYKFGSFLLEAGAFLATWLVLDAAISGLRRLQSPGRNHHC